MESGILHHSHSTPIDHHHHLWPSTFSPRFPSLSSHLPPLRAKYPRGMRDSGTDRVRSWNSSRHLDGERRTRAKKQRRRWWSDDGLVEPEEMAPGFWEEFMDSMWFFKVLGSYGWMLPFIILSWLAASGPKAFLTAFSIPLGLSVLTFVFKKLLRWIQSKNIKGYRSTSRKKSRAIDMENLMMEEDEQEIQRRGKQRTWYKSNPGEPRENGSVNSNGAPSFGGWDDLIDEWEFETRQAQRSTRARNKTKRPLEQRMRELKSRVEGERDLPLLLRLLVAVFPFLSSWTNLL